VPINIVSAVTDKIKLFNFLKKNKINTPKIYSSKNNINNLNDIVIKERFGKASKGLSIINNITKINRKLILKKIKNKNNIIQEYLHGEEYGMDILNNFKREYEGVLVRKKILMKNGETKKAEIVKPRKFQNLSKKLSRIIKHVGAIDVDVIRLNRTNYVIDINPRFSGGYILSHKAGSNIPGFLINLIKKKKFTKKNFLKQNFGKVYKQ
jgi:carbamoyl-phosphate synthase large subunit